jgi:hypothetical protein
VVGSVPATAGGAARGSDVVQPAAATQAATRVALSAVSMLTLVAGGRVHHPREHVGRRLSFADGSNARVYRETRLDAGEHREPAVLVVGFVLRGVHGRGHAAFRLESWLNTPLFAGFPGLVSKLWLSHDEAGRYRGFYEWDGADRAADYVHALGWVLGLVCVPGSVCAHIVPDVGRDEALADPSMLGAEGTGQWWCPSTPTTLP